MRTHHITQMCAHLHITRLNIMRLLHITWIHITKVCTITPTLIHTFWLHEHAGIFMEEAQPAQVYHTAALRSAARPRCPSHPSRQAGARAPRCHARLVLVLSLLTSVPLTSLRILQPEEWSNRGRLRYIYRCHWRLENTSI
jgi:hypothetical protein